MFLSIFGALLETREIQKNIFRPEVFYENRYFFLQTALENEMA